MPAFPQPAGIESDNPVRKTWTDVPFRVQWRAAIVRLPRLTPRIALRVESPEGPYPFIVKLPGRHADGLTPVHIDFHGAGFVMGSSLEQAPFCAKLARERGCLVLCPDYSLGPLRQFPAALEDGEDVLTAVLDREHKTEAGRMLYRSVAERRLPKGKDYRKASDKKGQKEVRIDPSRLSLSGFSSGGNIALNLVQSASVDNRDWPSSLDQRLLPHERDVPEDVKPGGFSRGVDENLAPTYLPERYRERPRANPGLEDPQHIHPQVKLFVISTPKDTLINQSEAWLSGLHDAGLADRVEVFRPEGMGHGYANFPERMLDPKGFKRKREAYEAMNRFWDRVAAESGHPMTNGRKSTANGG